MASREEWREEVTILLGALTYAVWLAAHQIYRPGMGHFGPGALVAAELLHWPTTVVLCLPILRLIRRYPIVRPHALHRAVLYVMLGLVTAGAYPVVTGMVVALSGARLPLPTPWPPRLSLVLTIRQLLDYGFLVAVMHACLLRRQTKRRALRLALLEAELAESRLVDIKEAMQPELLLWSLRRVGEAFAGEVASARRLIARLGDFLRLSQESLNARLRSVEDELALVESVLDFAHATLGPRLSLDIDIPGARMRYGIPHRHLLAVIHRTIGLVAAGASARARVHVRTTSDHARIAIAVEVERIEPEQAASLAMALEENVRDCQGRGCDLRSRFDGAGRLEIGVELPLEAPRVASEDDDLLNDSPLYDPRLGPDPSLRRGAEDAIHPRKDGPGWWPFIALWTSAMGGGGLYVWALSRNFKPLEFILYASVWGAIGLPILRGLAVRYPLTLARVPAYFGLGILLCLVCPSVVWLLQPGGGTTLVQSVLYAVGSLWTFGMLVAVTHLVIENHRHEEGRFREIELRRQLAGAELAALEMQLRPHFLFNALHSVAALLGHDPVAARGMVRRIEEFLRLSFESSGARMVSLHTELRFLKHYLDIQRVRFQDRLTVVFAVDAEAAVGQIPNLILQPIVENAIRHGIAPRARGGQITVRADRRGDRLELAVEDDGVGAVHPIGPSQFGLGLSNTQARLRLLYGEDHRFLIRTARGCSFAVFLDVPFQPASRPDRADEASAAVDAVPDLAVQR